MKRRINIFLVSLVEDEARNVPIPHLHHLHAARTRFSVPDSLQVHLPFTHRSSVHLFTAPMHSRWLKAEQTLKREHASTYALKHPFLEFSLTW